MRRIARWTLGLAAAGSLFFAAVAFWPLNPDELVLTSEPVEDYAEARRQIDELIARPLGEVREACRGRVLDHGRKVGTAVVLLHGLTNCPKQFAAFGQLAHEAGANVLIPRTPYHGYADRMTRDLELLDAQGMLDNANRAVDLARGLGERVVVVGLSVNGVTAAWLAQKRSDVDEVVLMAPFFAPKGVGRDWVAPLARLLYRLPNLFVWWDPVAKERLEGSDVSYPQFSTHAIAQVMRMGLDVFTDADAAKPKAGRAVVMTSAADAAINLGMVADLAATWRERGEPVEMEEFSLELGVPHDSVDPLQPGARIEVVYPALLEQIGL